MKPPPRRRVLIVDDNRDLTVALEGILASASVSAPDDTPTEAHATRVETLTACNGQEALALARAQRLDVAIVDVKLPDTSGVDLIDPLKSACPFCEVILITGDASMDVALAALRSGAFAFVLKSFRPEELISTVEQALIKVSLKRERDELERRYRAVVELTDVLAVGLDTEDSVVLFNRKACELSGTDTEAALGLPFLESWIPEPDRDGLREAIAEARTGARSSDVETAFTPLSGTGSDSSALGSPPGRTRQIRWHLSAVPHEGGGADPGVVYGIGIDVTERRLLEKRAADAEAMSAMGTLALNLAHEIRNPLNAAVLQLHLLEKALGKLEVAEDVRDTLRRRTETVEDEIGRLNRLLTEFLQLARPRGIAHEPVHVSRLVEDIIDLQKATAEGADVHIQCRLAEDGCVAMGDREKLKQVVLNLVVNALEAMREGGTLSVAVSGEPGWVHVTVEDTGVGVDADVLPSVFDAFFTTKEGGTGLGLSIVRKIVDQHCGRVVLDSARGQGTRVRVSLPAR